MHETTHALRLQLRVAGDLLAGSVVDDRSARGELSGRIGLPAPVGALVHPDTHDLPVASTRSRPRTTD